MKVTQVTLEIGDREDGDCYELELDEINQVTIIDRTSGGRVSGLELDTLAAVVAKLKALKEAA